ncbi:hypothetical protein [Amycolatopsis sp. NPDC004169]|uniref:hypothetical protein n=1 Tax=Amycolatopsis sp. NPDC004169 TaxID=3154453 RepID=UPI0033AD9A11
MLGTTAAGGPSPEERRRAARTVQRHARNDDDEAELLAMLGLDHTDPPPAEPRPANSRLTADELRELLAPFAEEHAGPAPLRNSAPDDVVPAEQGLSALGTAGTADEPRR